VFSKRRYLCLQRDDKVSYKSVENEITTSHVYLSSFYPYSHTEQVCPTDDASGLCSRGSQFESGLNTECPD
jgi:hypothetical protein